MHQGIHLLSTSLCFGVRPRSSVDLAVRFLESVNALHHSLDCVSPSLLAAVFERPGVRACKSEKAKRSKGHRDGLINSNKGRVKTKTKHGAHSDKGRPPHAPTTLRLRGRGVGPPGTGGRSRALAGERRSKGHTWLRSHAYLHGLLNLRYKEHWHCVCACSQRVLSRMLCAKRSRSSWPRPGHCCVVQPVY